MVVEQIFFGLILVGILVWGAWSRNNHRDETIVFDDEPIVFDDEPEVRYARHLKHPHDDKDTP